MSEKLTRGMIEDMASCDERDCTSCKGVCRDDTMSSGITRIAKALLAEMDKPGVWEGAPEWATNAIIKWAAPTHYSGVYKEYARELPKTRIDEIAEEYSGDTDTCHPMINGKRAVDVIKAAILCALEEKESEK